MIDFFKKHTLITGTLLLTAAGFTARVLGFFYRIFLSRAIGAEGLGLYNMVHPVYGICFALCAGSVQTALSQCVAANIHRGKTIFRAGLVISLTIGMTLAFLMVRFSWPLAHYILLEDQCAPLLPIMAISVPFSAIHACINGYYYGIQKAGIPAFSQVAEQIVRMGAVFLIAGILAEQRQPVTVELAVAGHLIGEIASCFYSVFCYRFFTAPEKSSPLRHSAFFQTVTPLMRLALPLMGNRLVINLLTSVEAIWIPNRLASYGLTSSQAFGVYGVLTGMAMPFILFPSAITNSMAVLLLPAVAEAQSQNQENRISQTISLSLRYSLYMGILCIGVFTLFGDVLGTSVFQDPSAGSFMKILAWLCPFLYLSTTTGSILNGLGRAQTTFFHNVFALIVRICFVLLGIPRFGITAYLWGLLGAELLLAFLHLRSLNHLVTFSWNVQDMIVKPSLALILSIGILRFMQDAVPSLYNLPSFIAAAVQVAFFSACYGGLLLLAHISKKSV